MGKIKVSALIDLFERMAREHWAYEWGAAKEGRVDCSGAFVYAYRALGGPYIEHGSNSIARKRCGTLQPISAALPGWACFKKRDWREIDRGKVSSWGDDIGDLYHIGLMGRDGKILNAQGEKNDFEADSTRGWMYAAPLAAVDYTTTADDSETEVGGMAYGNATARMDSGWLNIRDRPGHGTKVVGKIYDGDRVDVQRDAGGAERQQRSAGGGDGHGRRKRRSKRREHSGKQGQHGSGRGKHGSGQRADGHRQRGDGHRRGEQRGEFDQKYVCHGDDRGVSRRRDSADHPKRQRLFAGG